VYSVNHELTDLPDKAAQLDEGKALIATISRLKYDMGRDRALEYVMSPATAYSQRYLRETPPNRAPQADPS
jgi:hypothetical protein